VDWQGGGNSSRAAVTYRMLDSRTRRIVDSRCRNEKPLHESTARAKGSLVNVLIFFDIVLTSRHRVLAFPEARFSRPVRNRLRQTGGEASRRSHISETTMIRASRNSTLTRVVIYGSVRAAPTGTMEPLRTQHVIPCGKESPVSRVRELRIVLTRDCRRTAGVRNSGVLNSFCGTNKHSCLLSPKENILQTHRSRRRFMR
jgi:hypothetical protein